MAELYKSVETVKQVALNAADKDKVAAVKMCPYFKQGLCNKGKKCKFSHDLEQENKEELDLYIDQR
jgi:hypothetical protein